MLPIHCLGTFIKLDFGRCAFHSFLQNEDAFPVSTLPWGRAHSLVGGFPCDSAWGLDFQETV